MGLHSAPDETYDDHELNNRMPSVPHLLRRRIARTPDHQAYQYFEGEELRHVTWGEFGLAMDEWAAGLVALGVTRGDRVAILSSTRYEWVLANWSIMVAGGATTTVYPTSQSEDVAFIVSDSGSLVVIAEDAVQVEKLRERRENMPHVRRVVVLDSAGVDTDEWVITVEQLTRLGRAVLEDDPDVLDAVRESLTSDDLCTIIYTSGTTGTPKGAELTHDALLYEGAAVASVGILSEDDLQFLWLPLSHVFGNCLLILAVHIGFPTCVDGRIDRIVENLAIVKPTFMGAAPRIFEKAHGKIAMTFEQETGVKAKLISWAFEVGGRAAEAREQGRSPSLLVSLQHVVADRLVLSKVRERFGGRVRFFISGSARLDPGLARWFDAAGLLIIEGYGLTETTAATLTNRPRQGSYLHGTIGWPLPGTEVRVAPDGEFLIRGPGVMRAYHGHPELTASVFTEDGFFKTGDIAQIDGRGFVQITDRKKDVFKTSGGKYIAPSLIETKFKALCPYAGQIVVLGDGRNYAAALITLDEEPIMAWAAHNGLAGASYAEVVAADATTQMVQGYVDQLNAGLNRWETIKRFTILERDLTVDDGELTPSLKLRRKVVADRYGEQISRLYTSEAAATESASS